jgi:hypothetical protein
MTKPKHSTKFHDMPKGIRKTTAGHYTVTMRLNGFEAYLGTFDTLDEAIEFHAEADNARVIRNLYSADQAPDAYDPKYLGTSK